MYHLTYYKIQIQAHEIHKTLNSLKLIYESNGIKQSNRNNYLVYLWYTYKKKMHVAMAYGILFDMTSSYIWLYMRLLKKRVKAGHLFL